MGGRVPPPPVVLAPAVSLSLPLAAAAAPSLLGKESPPLQGSRLNCRRGGSEGCLTEAIREIFLFGKEDRVPPA